jgi:flagellin
MSLVVNTNVSSLTAQRALASANLLQNEAMTRLSTGSKINSASDDAAGLAIAQRMTGQINGLNMAVKNANDGIAMTKSIEGALVEVSDMLQRLRELSVQASNDTNTDVDRVAIQEEVDLLTAEITRVSTDTRYNGQTVLDGSFASKQLQVGYHSGESITMSVDSVAANVLGSYKVVGDRIEAQLNNGAGDYDNLTDAADDIIINGDSVSKTIDVVAEDSAKAVAAKINAVSGETGVKAEAKTYGLLYSEYATDQTYSIRVQNKTTGNFTISNSNVADAVSKINAISGATGVTAQATDDNKIRLYSVDGSDIQVENESTNTALRVQTLGHDGESTIPSQFWHRAKADTAGGAGVNLGALNATTYTLVQRSTGQTYTFNISATTTGEPTAANIQTALNNITGVSGFHVTDASGTTGQTNNSTDVKVTATEAFGAFDIYSGTDITASSALQTFDGVGKHLEIATANLPGNGVTTNYTITNDTTGSTYTFSATGTGAGATDAAAFQTAINNVSGLSGWSAYADKTTNTTVHIHGAADFGEWTLSVTGGAAVTVTDVNDGDINLFDVAMAAGSSSDDAATVQGTISLSSSKSFSVTQSAEESGVVTDPATATGSIANDNYFTTQSGALTAVSSINLRSQAGASSALAVLDGAIEKISSMRSSLGAVENRLDHTVSNLMNISEKTEGARSRLEDADFAGESAKLAKAQVLKSAGVGMLAQANASSQLILQLLQ